MKTMYMTIPVIVMILFSSFAKISGGGTSVPLESTRWELTNVYDNTDSINVSAGKAFLRFDLQKGSVGGNGSCNSYGGQLTIHGDSLTISHIFSTKMYCEGVQAIENAFLKALEETDHYVINGNILYLYRSDKLILTFKAA